MSVANGRVRLNPEVHMPSTASMYASDHQRTEVGEKNNEGLCGPTLVQRKNPHQEHRQSSNLGDSRAPLKIQLENC